MNSQRLNPDADFRRQQERAQQAARQQEEAAGIPPHRQTLVVERMTEYLTEYVPRHLHLMHVALEHYATNLGHLWGKLFARYGRPRWAGGKPCENTEAEDPLASVPGFAEGSATAAFFSGAAASSSAPTAPTRHDLEPPS